MSHDCGFRPTIEHAQRVLTDEITPDAPSHNSDEVLSSITLVLAELTELETDHNIDHEVADQLGEELEGAEDTLAQIRTWFDLDDESSVGWVSAIEQRARELEELRARDESAKAVVHAGRELHRYWRGWPQARRDAVRALSPYVHDAADRVVAEVHRLDTLARAHDGANLDGESQVQGEQPADRLRQLANSARYRGTTVGSDLHVVLNQLERLRTRDEAAKAVVQVWAEVRDRPNARWPVPIVDPLDALARAHQEATINAELQVPAERLDLTGRDPATVTPIELLAFAYPDVYALMQDRDTAAAAVERVRQLHKREGWERKGTAPELLYCGHCSDESIIDWPCPTIEALDEPDRPEPR